MGFFEFFLAGLAKDGLLFLAFFRRRKAARQDRNLREWHPRGRFPIIDWYLRKATGHPSTWAEKAAARIIPRAMRSLRWMANSTTFELMLGYVVRGKLRAMRPKATNGRAGIRRMWPRIKLVS
jgi:hypothetical protein